MEPRLDAETIWLREAPPLSGHEVYRFQAPSQGDNRQPGLLVSGVYYRAPGSARRPLVVLLPIWGASTHPQRTTAKRLLRGPYGDRLDVVTLDGERHLLDWEGLQRAGDVEEFFAALTGSVRTYETTVADVRRVVRWAAGLPAVDQSRIALVGYSLSAVMGVTLLALEPRLHSAALVMTGGQLDAAMARCPRRAARARRNLLSLTGWSRDRYRREIAPQVAGIEPLAAAAAVDPARVLYIDAAKDACLPDEGREELWRALGRPERLILPQNHFNAFLTMTILGGHSTTRHIVRFLERRLFEPVHQPAPTGTAAGLD